MYSMKMSKKKAFCIICFILLFVFPLNSFAHSGRTDAQGGHHDYKNKSGLGSYHYHHGMEAHLHPNGVCPYSVNSGDSVSTVPDTREPEIEIKEYPGTLFVGESAGLEYSVNNAESGDSSVASSNSGVVKVNSDGTLTAVGAGTAEITIKASGVTKTFQVEVKTVPVAEVKITDAPEKIQLGESCKLSAKVLPENATSKNISWQSDNEEILEVDESGTVTGKAAGEATITAVSENQVEAKAAIEVYEVLPEDIECEDSIVMIVGDKKEFQIKILPDNSNKKNYTVACADSDILKCEDSNLEAVAEGETILHIETWNGVKKDVPVKVDIIPVEDIEIEDKTEYLSSNTIDKSTEIVLSAKVSPGNATYQDVEWSSSDENILSVEDGQFVIHGTGEVTLSCKAQGGVERSISLQVVDRSQNYLTGLLAAGVVGGGSVLVVRKRRKKRRG